MLKKILIGLAVVIGAFVIVVSLQLPQFSVSGSVAVAAAASAMASAAKTIAQPYPFSRTQAQ